MDAEASVASFGRGVGSWSETIHPPSWRKPCLAPPQNVTLLSRNFSVYLTWLPGPGYSQNVTYFVAYQSAPTPRRWRKVKKCAGTKELACSLMCLEKQDLYNKFKGRVWAVSPSARSPSVESNYLDYLFEVEPAPPTLVVTRTEEILSINATYQLPHCMPPPDLKYEVDFWKEGIKNKTQFPATPHGQPVQIPLQPAISGHYCLRARTIYTFGDPKYSEFSKPTCFFLGAPENQMGIPGAATTSASTVVSHCHRPRVLEEPHSKPLVSAGTDAIGPGARSRAPSLGTPRRGIGERVGPKGKSSKDPNFKNLRRIPIHSLTKGDFSGYRHSVATFQPSGPEYLDILVLCPQKELTRKVRPSPGIRTPVIFQAGYEKNSAEEEKEDEEDTDDCVSFQPYLEPPPFLGQEHQIPRHSEAGSTWSVPAQVEDSSATDASDRSWASTGGSSPWDEPGSSCYLAKKTPGQGPSGDGCQEPLSLPEFSNDMSFLEDPLKDDLSFWANWGFSSPGLNIVPGEPPVSLHTLTFCWDSCPEEEEEEEEEEEIEGGREQSKVEDDSTGNWGARSLQKSEVRGETLGHYMAR
ncbi:Interferon lambda receptor 1 [Vulpes lagopus]